MYSRYSETLGYKTDVVEMNDSDHGGYKEISVMIQGQGAYSKLKYENGAHRVQRVPETESGGRIHTSTATVAVLPEAEDVEIDIRTEDLKIETYRSSGSGGQHVSCTNSRLSFFSVFSIFFLNHHIVNSGFQYFKCFFTVLNLRFFR